MTRKPRQERSKATVKAVIEASFIAVARHGIANTTTRHIADMAGISVGSLYEYFENKEAVFAAMHARFVEDIVGVIQPLAPELIRMPIDDAVRTLMNSVADFLRRDNGIYLACARNALQVDISDYLEPVNKALMELVMLYIMHNPELARVRNIPTMAYIFINGGIFTVLRQLSDPHPPISFGQLSEGLADMVSHYVEKELERAA
jgi:AcrR family transcriptional regulator